MKSVSDQFKARRRAFGNQNFHDIETEEDVRIIKKTQPGQSAAGNALLLCTIDGIKGTSEIFARACFYLDEDECIAVATNNVNLATPASAKISIKNLVAVAAQESAGKFFTAHAKPKMLWVR